MTSLVKRSMTLSRHRTSIALEKEFWALLEAIAARKKLSLSALIKEIDSHRPAQTGLASSLRIAVLKDILTNEPPKAHNNGT